MLPGAVVAVVAVPDGRAAVLAQTRPAEEIVTGADALTRAARSRTDWVWLIAPSGEPRPDALEALLAVDPLPGHDGPAVLAGTVRDRHRATVIRDLPAGDEHNPEVVEAVARRMLPIRSTTFANCLVARTCFERHGLPDTARYGRFAAVEWSARVLRAERGYYVPASVVVTNPERSGSARSLRSIGPLFRMVRTGAWTRGDVVANARWWLDDARAPAVSGPR